MFVINPEHLFFMVTIENLNLLLLVVFPEINNNICVDKYHMCIRYNFLLSTSQPQYCRATLSHKEKKICSIFSSYFFFLSNNDLNNFAFVFTQLRHRNNTVFYSQGLR